jgi:UDP-N-acetylmuramate--alanine ligase
VKTRHYHIVGIAGAGMSAIANLLLDQGYPVSGSDPDANRMTATLTARGAQIFRGHSPEYVRGADVVLATSAVRMAHPELAAAQALGIPVLRRADLWRAWSAERAVVAVAGSHGKTTTSAMIAVALRAAGLPIGYLIGAEVPDLGGNAAWGDPAAPLVIEADEYERTFLALTPAVAVITNIEWDHPDIYPSAADYTAAFQQFAAQTVDHRRLVLCHDDPGAAELGIGEATLYGIEEQFARDPVSCRLAPLDWAASGLRTTLEGGMQFDLWRYDRRRFANRLVGTQTLALPGAHNVRNALAALAAVDLLGADLSAAAAALARFRGTARRFELKGEIHGITVIDDYAHHPTEVRATLAAARRRYPERRIVAYLQPHTFSRTTALLEQWAGAVADADIVLVGDIYAARETGAAADLARTLVATLEPSHPNVGHSGDVAASTLAARALLQPGDILLTLGAGDGYLVGEAILTQYTAS